MQTLCAFANGDGGRVIFGVGSRGEILGQRVSDQTLHEIAACKGRFEPPLDFAVRVVDLTPERKLIVLRVHPRSDVGLSLYDGRGFERVASTTRRMSLAQIGKRTAEFPGGPARWENQVADGLSLRDLDRGEVQRFFDIAVALERLPGPARRVRPRDLDRLGLRIDGQIRRAAVVLFGREPYPRFPQCHLMMARFRGTDKTEFLDHRSLHGPAFRLLEEAQVFLRRHLPVSGRIEPDRWQRVDRPLIPPDATREILVNALVHRDYSRVGSSICLALFDDRVEIWSPGTLPHGVTAEALLGDHLSVRRNPTIADAFLRAGLIENWGRGTNRVIEMCAAHGIPAPEFREVGEAVQVTFRVPVAGPWLEMAVKEGSTARYGEEPPRDPLETALLYELRNGPLSLGELARQLGYRRPTARLRRVLQELLERDRIEPVASGEGASRSPRYRRISPAELRPFKPRPAR